ncbi:hypothetical protein F5050DRAFT_1716502 [Lentinula boryana]|uniref:Velvet domain-containing protein n=1 Tax=Lentinula boryana TaxID=40481 RepID=A0ABQ8PWX2_9AGAR|nr:hypothetical protein F5050DRAFT_1716502 [Lentinula boryana]
MVNTRSRRAHTNTDNSDNILEETVVVNPFMTNASSFALFVESISGAGLPRHRNNAFGPAPSQPATARVSSLHALGSPDQSKFKYQVLYTADGNPITPGKPSGAMQSSAKVDRDVDTTISSTLVRVACPKVEAVGSEVSSLKRDE